MENTESMAPHQLIEDQGFIIFRNVFDDNDIRSLRSTMDEAFKKEPSKARVNPTRQISNCSSNVPQLNWILSHDKFIQCIRDALNTNDIVYTSVFAIQRDMMGGWHKDDGTGSSELGYFLELPYGNKECKVVRIAFYLQKHDSRYPGILLSPGSHKYKSWSVDKFICPELNPGDVIIFDVRLNHSGTPRSKLYQAIAKIIPAKYQVWLGRISSVFRMLSVTLSRKNKHAIFMAFGVDNSHTVTYSKSLMKNQLSQPPGGDCGLPSQAKQILDKKNIKYLARSEFI